MSNELVLFENEGNEYPTTQLFDNDGNQCWLLKEICDIIGLSTTSQVAEKLENDELVPFSNMSQTHVYKQGPGRPPLVVNEKGLYHILVSSDKPLATIFKEKLFEDLPRLRKAMVKQKEMTGVEYARMLLAAEEEKERLNERLHQIRQLTGPQENGRKSVHQGIKLLGLEPPSQYELSIIGTLVAQKLRDLGIEDDRSIQKRARPATLVWPEKELLEALREILGV